MGAREQRASFWTSAERSSVESSCPSGGGMQQKRARAPAPAGSCRTCGRRAFQPAARKCIPQRQVPQPIYPKVKSGVSSPPLRAEGRRRRHQSIDRAVGEASSPAP